MAYTNKLDFLANEIIETAKADKAASLVAVGDGKSEGHMAFTGDTIAILIFIYSFITQISEKDGMSVDKIFKVLKRMYKLDSKHSLIKAIEEVE